MKIYTNKIANKIPFKIKTLHYLELLTPETMKLLGSTKSKITENKMVKMCLIQKLQNQYQYVTMLLIKVISKI